MNFDNAKLIVWLVYAGLVLITGNQFDAQMHWIALGFILLIGGLHLVERVWNALLMRRELVAFRSLDAGQREAFLASLWPRALRYEYTRRVDMEEVHDVDGMVERFPFPRAERTLHWRLFWIAAALAALPLLAAAFIPALPLPVRVAIVLVGAAAIIPAAWLTGRLALLSSQLEVTPFSVALIWPAGRRAVMLLNQPLLLVNRPARGFFELRVVDGTASIRIHHARLASTRAVNLIVERGGFEPAPTNVEGTVSFPVKDTGRR